MDETEDFESSDSPRTPEQPDGGAEREPDPALIYQDSGHEGAGTHVLIIGISHYAHLLGGSKPRPDIAMGMKQLRSPARSARELAKWFLDDFDNPDKPLASLALVLSESDPAKFSHPKSRQKGTLPTGTFDEVGTAVAGWIDRASSDSDNQVIFFFSGHGVSSGDSVLLLRDFGEPRHNRFNGALNLSDFLTSMMTQVPDYQLFLIDACRSAPSFLRSAPLKQHLGRGCYEMRDLSLRGGRVATQSVHHASSIFSRAYGRKDGLTLFTEALLQAFQGGGAQSSEQWWVSTLGLQTALAAYIKRSAKKMRIIQQPQIVGSQFTVNKPACIAVPVYITTKPTEGLGKVARAEARLNNELAAEYSPNTHGVRSEWFCVLKHFDHQLSMSFPQDSEYNDHLDILKLGPPCTEFPVSLRKRR